MSEALAAMVGEYADKDLAQRAEIGRLKRELSAAHDEIESLGTERDAATEERAKRDGFAGSYHLDNIEQLLRGRHDLAVKVSDLELKAKIVTLAVAKLDEIGVGVLEQFDELQASFEKYLAAAGFGFAPVGVVEPVELEDFRNLIEAARDKCDLLTDYPKEWGSEDE